MSDADFNNLNATLGRLNGKDFKTLKDNVAVSQMINAVTSDAYRRVALMRNPAQVDQFIRSLNLDDATREKIRGAWSDDPQRDLDFAQYGYGIDSTNPDNTAYMGNFRELPVNVANDKSLNNGAGKAPVSDTDNGDILADGNTWDYLLNGGNGYRYSE